MARSIHSGLVGERRLVGTRYLADPALRAEYVTDIAPRTEAALRRVLSKVALPAPARVLDLGAGTGAAGRAILAAHPGIDLVSVDKVKGPGVLVADLSRAVRPTGVQGRFDWIVAAHLLNELATGLDPEALLRLVRFWISEYLADGGSVILVEPALRVTSRGLLRLRDGLLANGLSVLAPCLFPGPCPALLRERDFCHDSAPAIVAGRSRVDFSYLVLARTPAAPASETTFRVVSDPMKEKGRLRLFGCGPAGRILLTRLDREHSETNQGFGELGRGELVRVTGATPTGEGLRLIPEARCERV